MGSRDRGCLRAPPTGYIDKNGNEAADKCTYPVVETQPDIYGTPLGGSLGEDTAFNQLINGHSYYTQQIWSNAPTVTPTSAKAGEPAGCSARIGPTPSFTAPASGETGHAIEFDGSASYDIRSAITKYEWSFGDGSPPVTTVGATPTHYYLTPGTYQVSLTVSDSSGGADASTQTLPITINGAAVGVPTASISAPANHQTYTLGESVGTSFSCEEASGGPGIESCKDSGGGVSPGKLDTSTVGPHSYTVTAVSLDGERDTATIEYTVVSLGTGPGGNGSGEGGGNGGNPGNSTSSSSGGGAGASPGVSASSSSTSGGSSGAGTTPTTAKPTATRTSAQKLAQAIKACRKLKKSKRARCVAAAKRRFAPAKGRHRKAKVLPMFSFRDLDGNKFMVVERS